MKSFKSILALTLFSLLGNFSAQDIDDTEEIDYTDIPKINHNPMGCQMDWMSKDGRHYFTEYSNDMESWSFMPVIRTGDGSMLSTGFQCSSPELFLRLRWSDLDDGGDVNTADFDGDGLANLAEINQPIGQQTNPLLADTDKDGLLDSFEIENGFNPTSPTSNGSTTPDGAFDSDGDGVSNQEEQNRGGDPNDPDDQGKDASAVSSRVKYESKWVVFNVGGLCGIYDEEDNCWNNKEGLFGKVYFHYPGAPPRFTRDDDGKPIWAAYDNPSPGYVKSFTEGLLNNTQWGSGSWSSLTRYISTEDIMSQASPPDTVYRIGAMRLSRDIPSPVRESQVFVETTVRAASLSDFEEGNPEISHTLFELTIPPGGVKSSIHMIQAPLENRVYNERSVFGVYSSIEMDLNNDGEINSTDTNLRKASLKHGATSKEIDDGTEYLFVNDSISNGIWDKEDSDPDRPQTANEDDDAQEIRIGPGISEGEIWLEHPAITGLSFYKTRECNAGDKINLSSANKFDLSSQNSFPYQLFMRADGALNFPENNPQIEGELILKLRAEGQSKVFELAKIKLTIVKELGAEKYFHATRDYILENNTKLYVDDRGFPSNAPTSTIRICAMLEEQTVMAPYESYHWDAKQKYDASVNPKNPGISFDPVQWAEGLGIEGVMDVDEEMTVVINGNQCGFSDGTTSTQAAFLAGLGEPLMTDRCQGRLAIEGRLNPASNDHYNKTTNAPGTLMKGSPLAGPDPIPSTNDPGGKYFYQDDSGNYVMGAGHLPVNLGPPGTVPQSPVAENGIGGLSSSYGSGDRNNYPNSFVGFHPMGDQGESRKGVVFVAMGKGANGNGKVPDLYQAVKSSGVPEISGATKSGTYSIINFLILDSGDTSCALAYKNPDDNFIKVYEGHKYRGLPYYVNTFLRFKTTKPR